MHAAEERVALGAEGHDAERPPPERSSDEERSGGAVHRVGEDGEPRGADRREVDERGEALAVGGREVHDLDACRRGAAAAAAGPASAAMAA